MPFPKALALILASASIAMTGMAHASDAPASEPVPAKPKKPKKICKNDNSLTGTRIAKRICKTEEEWAAKEDGQEVGMKSKTSRDDMTNVGGMGQP